VKLRVRKPSPEEHLSTPEETQNIFSGFQINAENDQIMIRIYMEVYSG